MFETWAIISVSVKNDEQNLNCASSEWHSVGCPLEEGASQPNFLN